MIIEENIVQGSNEWFSAKCGVVSMSHAPELLTKGKGVTRRNYILDVAAERLSGMSTEKIQTDAMIRGIEMERFALEAYMAETGRAIHAVGLGYLDDTLRICASPDGLTGSTTSGGVEIKCPGPRAHMQFLAGNAKKYMPQVQGNMWVFEAESWDLVSFCPEFEAQPMKIITIERDAYMIALIAESAAMAVIEVDELVAMIRENRYRNPKAVEDACARSLQHMYSIFSDGEVVL